MNTNRATPPFFALLTLAGLVTALASPIASQAYDFAGYYVPAPRQSAFRPDAVYSPVGMGTVTSRGGFRVHPVTGRGDFHNGVDLAAKLNEPVYCLLDGIVTRVGKRGNLGVAVEVYHPYPNVRTICGHLNAYAVRPGDIVARGRVIGYAGSTGRSTGVHVHYTVVKEDTNEYIEPYQFIKAVPNYVAAINSAEGRFAYAQNMRTMPKFDRKLIDTDTEDLPAQKPKREGPPPASLEP